MDIGRTMKEQKPKYFLFFWKSLDTLSILADLRADWDFRRQQTLGASLWPFDTYHHIANCPVISQSVSQICESDGD